MTHYPIFLKLNQRVALVVGAGRVALRKTRALVEAGARVVVVSPQWDPEFERLPVRLVPRRFRVSDLTGVTLVFAATNDRSTNHRIGIAAKSRGVLANISDCAEECDFIVPARASKGDLHVAISTGGKNPRLSSKIRKKLEALL